MISSSHLQRDEINPISKLSAANKCRAQMCRRQSYRSFICCQLDVTSRGLLVRIALLLDLK